MEKTLKIIVKLAYDRILILEPTQDNLQLAMRLANTPLYDDKWGEDGMTYFETDYNVDVKMERVRIEVSQDAEPKAAD